MPFVHLNTFRNGLATNLKIYQLSMHAIILFFWDNRKKCTKYETCAKLHRFELSYFENFMPVYACNVQIFVYVSAWPPDKGV